MHDARHARRPAPGLGAFVLCLLLSDSLLASEHPQHGAELRGGLGAGVGNAGFAGRLGLSGDLRLSRELGVGVHGGWLGQTAIFSSRSAWLLGPEVTWKSHVSANGVWLLSLSPGFARMRSDVSVPCGTSDPDDVAEADGGAELDAAAEPEDGATSGEEPPRSGFCLFGDRRSEKANVAHVSLEVGHQYEWRVLSAGLSLRGDLMGWPGAERHFTQFTGTLNVTVGMKGW